MTTHLDQAFLAPATSVATTDVDSLLENVSRQMTFPKLARRHSVRHSSDGRRCPIPRSGETKRVFKVASTGNSPRKLDRRRHVNSAVTSQRSSYVEGARQHNAALAFRQQQSRPTTWHTVAQPGWADDVEAFVQQQQSEIPVYTPQESWALPQQQQQMIHAATSTPQVISTPLQQYRYYNLNHASTPLQLETPDQLSYWQPQFTPQPYQFTQINSNYFPCDTPHFNPFQQTPHDPSMSFDSNSSPPTPHDSTSNLYAMPKSTFFFSDDTEDYIDQSSIPNDDVTGGTELVGMGLYDDRKEALDNDPMLVMSRLISGTDLAKGKGLKLEETWEPPEDDEQDKSDSSDDDNDGDVEDEAEVETESQQQSPTELSSLSSTTAAGLQLAEDGTMMVPVHAAGSLDGGWI